MGSARAPLIALLIVLCLSGAASLWEQARSGAGIDFYQMWIGARMARETRDFYAPATRQRMGEEYLRRAVAERSPRQIAVARHRRNLESLSTPFLYLLYAPLRGSYERDLLLFQLAMFAAFAAWVALLARAWGFGLPLALALGAFLLLAFEPVRSDARVANMNHAMLLMLAGAVLLTARRRFFAAGALLAIATLTKPYVIVVLPLTYAFWMLQRRWRDLGAHIAGAASAAIVGLIASSLYFRSATIWLDWLREFRAMPPSMVPLEMGNIALARVIRDTGGIDVSLVFIALFFALAVIMARRARAPEGRAQSAERGGPPPSALAPPPSALRPPPSDFLAIGLGCVIFQFGSPLVWVHHLLLTVPLAAYLLRPAGDDVRARPRIVAGAIALALIAVEPWALFVPATIHVAALANAGLVAAYAGALYDLGTAS